VRKSVAAGLSTPPRYQSHSRKVTSPRQFRVQRRTLASLRQRSNHSKSGTVLSGKSNVLFGLETSQDFQTTTLSFSRILDAAKNSTRVSPTPNSTPSAPERRPTRCEQKRTQQLFVELPSTFLYSFNNAGLVRHSRSARFACLSSRRTFQKFSGPNGASLVQAPQLD